MKYNALGETGMRVSHLSLGGAAFSHLYGSLDSGGKCCEETILGHILAMGSYGRNVSASVNASGNPKREDKPQYDEDKSVELIRTCLKKGINYIDTSPWYGQGSSEIIIGKALKGIERSSYFIGSKVGRYDVDVRKMFDFSAERTLSSVDLTLQRLQLNYVDVIQVHDLSLAPDTNTILRETLPALAKVVQQGKARHIGLADYDLALMKEIVEDSEVKIDTLLSFAKSTMIDNRLQKYVDFFQRHGVGVINAASNAMGLLTNEGPQQWHPAPDEIKVMCRQAGDYCRANGVQLAKLAQWYSFHQKDIATNVIGVKDTKQLDTALEVMSGGLNEHELMVYRACQERFFKANTYHWDGVEIAKYQEQLMAAMDH